jgi:4-alpha-glucanotransferase
VRQRFEEREFFFRYVQWIAYSQWMAAKGVRRLSEGVR